MINMDEIEQIKKVIETGEVSFGTRSVEKLLKAKTAKLIVISENCPKETRADIENHAKIAGVPIYNYNGTSLKLGEVCRKPFPISTMAIVKTGQSQIMKLRSNK